MNGRPFDFLPQLERVSNVGLIWRMLVVRAEIALFNLLVFMTLPVLIPSLRRAAPGAIDTALGILAKKEDLTAREKRIAAEMLRRMKQRR